MLWDVSQSRLLSGILAVLALAGAATVSDRPALAQSGSHPCHLLTSTQDVPNGFGAAYNLFSAAKELLLNVACGSSSNATLTVGNGQSTTYIYRLGYEWLDGQWKPIAFGGENLVANDWYVGNASANLFRSQTQLAQDNFVVAYTCHWINNQWKCGCRDSSCSQNYWQLQAFRQEAPSGGGQPTGAWPAIAGMKLHWSWTPKTSDKGKTGEASGYWLVPPGAPQTTTNPDWWKHGGTVHRVAPAPDGTLAFEIRGQTGKHSLANIHLTLWGNDMSKNPKVWRFRYRLFIEKNFLQAVESAGFKWPGGMLMGPETSAAKVRAGGRPFSKAGESCASSGFQSWAEKSASTRLHFPPSGTISLYTYHVPEPGKDCPIRSFYHTSAKWELGRWINIETEFKNQSAKGKADGYQKIWIDGKLVGEQLNFMWVPPHISPQPFRGPWFHWYGGGSPIPLKQDVSIWIRDMEAWVK